MKPTLSIITPLFNKGPYVAETIHSVQAQTMEAWELIVVENGSTDNGPEVVRQFTDARIRLVVSPKLGPGAARNLGMSLANGEWILFLDADDLIAPDYLEERLGLLRDHPEADLLVGCWEEFMDGMSVSGIIRQPAAWGGTAKDIADAAIAYAPWILHAALIRKSRLPAFEAWREHLDALPYEDAAFWFPVICDAAPAWSAKAGALYRVQTSDSRNAIVNASRTISAVIGVVAENVKFLRSTGQVPNAAQTGNLVRTFESAYRTALKLSDRKTATLALEQATFWLNKAEASGRSLRLRRLLGLRLFNLFRYGVI